MRRFAYQTWPHGVSHVSVERLQRALIEHGVVEEHNAAGYMKCIKMNLKTADQVSFPEVIDVIYPVAELFQTDMTTGNYHLVSIPLPLTTTKAQTFVAGMVAGLVIFRIYP